MLTCAIRGRREGERKGGKNPLTNELKRWLFTLKHSFWVRNIPLVDLHVHGHILARRVFPDLHWGGVNGEWCFVRKSKRCVRKRRGRLWCGRGWWVWGGEGGGIIPRGNRESEGTCVVGACAQRPQFGEGGFR